MIKKLVFTLLLIVSIVLLQFSNHSFANPNNIKIFVDGFEISTDQAPLVKSGRTLVPLRAIFEALNAKIEFQNATKKITATRDNTTIVLYLGSNQAMINDQIVSLDVPAQVVNRRTVVPVRFVSEALGDKITYNSKTKEVSVQKKKHIISDLQAKDVNNFGDGRDVEVTFNKVEDESKISHYRVMVVKTSKADKFDVNIANKVATKNYTLVQKEGKNIRKMLTSTTRDTDGALLENDISYTVFVLAVSSVNYSENILAKTSAMTLANIKSVPAVTNLTAKDVSEYGDGRDIEISFSKVADESNLLHYRAIVVRADESTQFNLSAAKELSSTNYTTITKNGANIKQVLSSQTVDHKGRKIQMGIAYQVFVLSVGNNTKGYGSSLSQASAQITLSNNPVDIRVTNVNVKDVADYSDGRDLEISFKIPSQETRVSEYRIMVVPSGEANNFTLSKANNVSSANYTVDSKTGADRSLNLSSSAKDVNGNWIRANTSYQVFVLSMGGAANNNNNALSTASSKITLTQNIKTVAVTNLVVSDISDYGDGRDIQVTFRRVSDETKISGYRILVVKAAQASGFNLAAANKVSSSNYTSVSKTGSNLTKTLSSKAKDVYGELIREGVNYRIFILSVSNGGNSENNAISTASSVISLATNAGTQAATNVTAYDVGNAGNGSDLEVRFTKVANETSISEYRIMVVKAGQANSFDLTAAIAVSSKNYTRVSKTGSNIIHRLSTTTRDVHGELIKPDQPYKVFVLSISSVGSANMLSLPSTEINLSNPAVGSVSNVTVFDIGNNGNGQDMQVSFNRATNEANVAYYLVMLVRSVDASSFNLASANLVPAVNYTKVNKTGNNITVTLNSSTLDVKGNSLSNNIDYQVFVLSVADGTNSSINALSNPSGAIMLTNKTVSWSGSFNEESSTNDGTILTKVTATLTGDTFVNPLTLGTHYTVSNLPAGLTINAVRLNSDQVEFSLTGKAETHNVATSITNLTITFNPSAFASQSVTGITNASVNNIAVSFID